LFQGGVGHHHDGCLIEHVMMSAEQQMEAYLRERKLIELVDHLVEFLERDPLWSTKVDT